MVQNKIMSEDKGMTPLSAREVFLKAASEAIGEGSNSNKVYTPIMFALGDYNRSLLEEVAVEIDRRAEDCGHLAEYSPDNVLVRRYENKEVAFKSAASLIRSRKEV